MRTGIFKFLMNCHESEIPTSKKEHVRKIGIHVQIIDSETIGANGQKQSVPMTMSYGAKLPQELVVDKLYRLSAKSLCRFKCVSKSWLTLISDPHFVKTHLNRNNNNNKREQRLILISDYIYSVDCAEASNNDAVIATKLDCDLSPIQYPGDFRILGSCNGLLLVNTEISSKFLLNPSTRESDKLPESPFCFSLNSSSNSDAIYGFGYDSSADDYKVVAIDTRADDADDNDDCDEPCCTHTIVSVYPLKTNCWRRIQDVPHYHSHLTPLSLVLVNGSLHWFTCRSSCCSLVIAAFDVADEIFRDVQIPSSLDKNDYDSVFYDLEVLGGCLCIIDHSDIPTDIWVMKEYGVTESWTKFITICLPNMAIMEPLCFLVDGEVLLKIEDENKLVAFNAKERTSRDIVVCGIPAMFKAGKTYVESLVSTHYNRGCGIERNYEGSEKF